MSERRKARMAALEILYQWEITDNPLSTIIESRSLIEDNEPLSDFSLQLVKGVMSHQGEIDKVIEDYTDNWALERMPILDRNIIRMSIYEMYFEEDIPVSVSINEAVELAKIYGTDDSSKFVNGILGKIAQDLQSLPKKIKKSSKKK